MKKTEEAKTPKTEAKTAEAKTPKTEAKEGRKTMKKDSLKTMTEEQKKALQNAETARAKAKAAEVKSEAKQNGDAKLKNKAEEAQAALRTAIEAMDIADSAARTAYVKEVKNILQAFYAGRPDALLKARVFDAEGNPADTFFRMETARGAFTASGLSDAKARAKAAAPVVVKVVLPMMQTLQGKALQDRKKAVMTEAGNILRAAARFPEDREAFAKGNAALCEAYRLCGAKDVKPRLKGAMSDVKAVLYAAKDIARNGDPDVIARGAVLRKVEAVLCASLQDREARDRAALRFAEEDRRAAEKAAAKTAPKKAKAPKTAPKKTVKAPKAAEKAAAK